MTRCEPFANEPVRKKVVRVDVCRTQTLLCSDGGNGLKCNNLICSFIFQFLFHFLTFNLALFVYYEEPRGNIPRALWAWAAKVRHGGFSREQHLIEWIFVLVRRAILR